MTESKLLRFEMRADEKFMKAVDDWRRKESDVPNRSEAIRRLVELGLKAKGLVKAKR